MTRRQLLWGAVATFGGAVGLTLVGLGPLLIARLTRRLLIPQPAFEDDYLIRVGRVSDFGVGVNTKFLQEGRICVVRNAERLYVIYAKCTHLGCTPDWAERDNKFKCPCHESAFCMGSAFDADGINCEGPAPRPLDRAHVELDSEGQVIVDVTKLYQWPKDGRSEFDNPGAFIPVSRG